MIINQLLKVFLLAGLSIVVVGMKIRKFLTQYVCIYLYLLTKERATYCIFKKENMEFSVSNITIGQIPLMVYFMWNTLLLTIYTMNTDDSKLIEQIVSLCVICVKNLSNFAFNNFNQPINNAKHQCDWSSLPLQFDW